jgi:hypothetical protein
VSDTFIQTWRVVSVVAAAILVVFFPERESEAIEDLKQSLGDL